MAKIFHKMLQLHWIFLYNLSVCSEYLTIIYKVTIYNNLIQLSLFIWKIDRSEGQGTCFIVSFCSKFPDIFGLKKKDL